MYPSYTFSQIVVIKYAIESIDKPKQKKTMNIIIKGHLTKKSNLNKYPSTTITNCSIAIEMQEYITQLEM